MSVLACDHDGPWHSQMRMERSPIYAIPALGNNEDGRESLTS